MAFRTVCILAALLSASASAARADLPTLRFLKLFPTGANAGTQLEIEVGGAEFDTVDSLRFDHPGLQAKRIASGRFQLTVAADTPVGTHDVWAVGKYGISNPRLFAVSHGLADVANREPNNSIDQAQPIEINAAVNGATDPNGNFYSFQARKGQRVICDCLAQRLMSIESRGVSAEIFLTLWSQAGQMLARNDHYYGNDPFLDYEFTEDGSYILELEDLNYASNKAYRLQISDGPHVDSIFPRAVEPGVSTDVTVYGQNLGPGSKPSSWQSSGPRLEERVWALTLPKDSQALPFQFSDHPTGLAFPVTCSTVRMHGAQIRPDWGGGSLNAVNLLSAWTRPVDESEPNDDRDHPQGIAASAVVNGRFDQPRDVDWYKVHVEETSKYSLRVYCESLGGRADPLLKIEDDRGNRLIELDDQSFGGQMADGRNRDPIGLVDLQAGQDYRIMVKDLHGRGGARAQYVLSLRKAEPDFFAMAWTPHITLGGVGNCRGTTLRRGGGDFVLVAAVHDGVPCPVTIAADHLPAGLHAAPCHLRGMSNATGAIVVRADVDAADWVGPLQFTATAQVDGRTIRRPVTPCTAPDANSGGRPMREFMAAVRNSSPFSLRCVPASLTVVPGGQVELKFIAIRHWPQWQGRIEIQNTAYSTLPVVFANQLIRPQETETSGLLQIPKQAEPGTYTICFQGIATVPISRDAASKTEEVTAYEPSLPLTITVAPPTAK
jgi:hypothetical protein